MPTIGLKFCLQILLNIAIFLISTGYASEADAIHTFLRKMASIKPDNCSMENLGPGVVQNLAQERFKRQAQIAVTRANLLTYLWKHNPDYLYRENVLYWLVSSLVESDPDIFGAGNCYDLNEFKNFGIFCPYAYRMGYNIVVKDLAKTHHYDRIEETEHEWFHEIRRIAHNIIRNPENRTTSNVIFYLPNQNPNVNYTTMIVNYDDGRWSMPYYDCGGGNIWMITYTVPFFGYDRIKRSYVFKGTSGIDIDLMQVDINQCPQAFHEEGANIFADTHKCKPTTDCNYISGLGFRRGSYKCYCKPGYYLPPHANGDFDKETSTWYFNGSVLEEAYDRKQDGESDDENDYDLSYECKKCPPGCDTCMDDRPCLYPINWFLRYILLAITIMMMCSICGWSWIIQQFRMFMVSFFF